MFYLRPSLRFRRGGAGQNCPAPLPSCTYSTRTYACRVSNDRSMNQASNQKQDSLLFRCVLHQKPRPPPLTKTTGTTVQQPCYYVFPFCIVTAALLHFVVSIGSRFALSLPCRCIWLLLVVPVLHCHYSVAACCC